MPPANRVCAGSGLTLVQASALIVAAALAAYWNSFTGAFQFDDYKAIVDNPAVASLAAWWQNMPGIRPLLKLSYAANREAGGLFGFHAVNLALHTGNALLLFALLRRLLGAASPDRRTAALAALLFVAHPAHSEAVTLISGRSMSLMATFYLVSLLFYLEERRWLSLLAFCAALAVRETAMTLPLALLLLERQRTKAHPEGAASLAQMFVRTRAYWLIVVLAAGALLLLPSFRNLATVSLETRSLGDNLITQSAALLYLLGQWLWPIALNADPVLPIFSGWSAAWVASILLCLGLAGWGFRAWWWKRTEAGWFGFAILWFGVHLAPTNSLLPRLDIANERHLYLAGVGFCMVGALWVTKWALRYPHLVPAGAAAIVLALAMLTHQRNEVYRDEIAFWQDVVTKSPNNGRAHNNLGYAYATAGNVAGALEAYDQSIRLAPADYKARLNRRALCRDYSARLPAGSCSTSPEPVPPQ